MSLTLWFCYHNQSQSSRNDCEHSVFLGSGCVFIEALITDCLQIQLRDSYKIVLAD